MTLEAVLCAACDSSEGQLAEFHGLYLHEECAPGHWQKDKAERDEFFEQIERKTAQHNKEKR